MFDSVGSPPPSTLTYLSGVVRSKVTARVMLVLGGLLATLGITATLYVSWMYDRARSDECDGSLYEDVTMADLVDLSERLQAYQRDPSPDAALVLSGPEVSLLMSEREGMLVQARFQGSNAALQLAIPDEQGCYNVGYLGEVRAEDGVVVFEPTHLTVGEVELTRWVRGRQFRLEPSDLPDDHAAQMLANTESIRVRDGQLLLQLVNRWDVW